MKHLSRICLSLAIIICCLIGIAVNAQAATVVASGTCGDNLVWTMDSDDTLIISGTGDMADYSLTTTPWDFFPSIKKIVIKKGVTSICDEAFSDVIGLSSVIISDTVTTIGDYAFANTRLKSINIPNSVTSIGKSAFYGCHDLQYTYYDNALYLGNDSNPYFALVAAKGEYIKSCKIHADTKVICGAAFNSCGELSAVNIPNGIRSIGNYAFRHCHLKNVTLPDSVTLIGDYAFYGCSSMTSITLSNNITKIGDYAFANCTKLKQITIPNCVTNIGSYAFSQCEKLNYNRYENGKYIGTSKNPYFALVSAPTSVTSFKINSKTKVICGSAFSDCGKLTSVDIPKGVISIGDQAFKYCYALKSIKIPNTVTSIGRFAFDGCGNLTSIAIPNSVTHIGTSAFNASGLTSISLPDSLTSISVFMFRYCRDLTSVIIPDSVTTIGDSAFYSCDSLESITIPDSVKVINRDIFGSCDGLRKVYFSGNAPTNIAITAFDDLKAKAYYPVNDTTWKNKRKDYSGDITWISYTPFKIITQPKTGYAANGSKVSATVKASGVGLTYQWYVKEAGEDKYVKSSIKTATYSCKMNSTKNGRYVRCKITDKYGNSVWTKTVRLWIKASITTQPTNKNVKDGTSVKFAVEAAGNSLKYQWQYRTSSDGSWKNTSAASGKTANYWVSATTSKNGYQYRCRVTDSAGNKVYSKTVTLYVFGIKTQPTSKTVVANKTAKFTVAATGKGLKYQWQYRTSSDGSWKNTSATGNKTKTLSVTATAAKHGYQYRCKITDSVGNTVNTKIVKLYILNIQTQPASKTVTAGSFTKFTVKTTGTGLTYQWQYLTSSTGSWKNVSASSGKTATYGLTAQSRHNGYRYRCKITDTSGNVIYTKVVTLTVK